MRLDFAELCGFRGFRDKVRFEFGAGFTVISGRNGVGKSTLCDAVEFAITGKIDKYKVESAARESLEDYLWWRGEGSSEAHYVSVGFITEDGVTFVVTRRRESGSNRSNSEIEAVLCAGPAPEHALAQLCKTSIIRDEWIAASSVDLSETERFDLVRSALGDVEGAEVAAKADAVLVSAKATHDRNDAAYQAVRAQLTMALTQLAEAQDAASRTGDVAVALQLLKVATPEGPDDLVDRLAAGRRALADRRVRLAALDDAVQSGRNVAAARRAFDAPERAEHRFRVRAALDSAKTERDAAEAAATQALQAFAREEAVDAVAASLSLLVEHGEQLGLHDDACPLCAAARTPDEFARGIELARARIAALGSRVSAARDALSAAEAELEAPREAFYTVDQEAAEIEQAETELLSAEASQAALLLRWGFEASLASDPERLARDYAVERGRLVDLERAMLTLEASQAISRISSLEDKVASLRQEVDALVDVNSRSEAAQGSARDIQRAVRRVGAEIIDERLAQISPLLNELYQRLRPHAAWRTIDYSIRGDVRRFLSLRVGDNLNPQFVFSSGQRRAAGLAFLLSVHLARAWTTWRTLLLDDPVQHIDDFRALQLVEVLAAFRMDGRQIVCAVEDEDLADVLCRRLMSTPEALGRRYDISVGVDGATVVVTDLEIPPLAPDVLRQAVGLQEVS